MDDLEFKFRLVSVDETAYCTDLPEGVEKIYGIYLVREGERTHVCSLTPSSYAVPIEKVADPMPEDQELWDQVEGFLLEASAQEESGTYFGYIDFETTTMPHSEAFVIEVEREVPEQPDSYERAVDQAWEEAIEYAHANPPYFDPAVRRREEPTEPNGDHFRFKVRFEMEVEAPTASEAAGRAFDHVKQAQALTFDVESVPPDLAVRDKITVANKEDHNE